LHRRQLKAPFVDNLRKSYMKGSGKKPSERRSVLRFRRGKRPLEYHPKPGVNVGKKGTYLNVKGGEGVFRKRSNLYGVFVINKNYFKGGKTRGRASLRSGNREKNESWENTPVPSDEAS